MELRGSVVTLLREDEEKRGDQPYLPRPGKLSQLKAARTEDVAQQRQRRSVDGDPDATRCRGDSDAAGNTEQGEEDGEVEPVDKGLSGVDGGDGMDHGRRKRRAGEEGD